MGHDARPKQTDASLFGEVLFVFVSLELVVLVSSEAGHRTCLKYDRVRQYVCMQGRERCAC